MTYCIDRKLARRRRMVVGFCAAVVASIVVACTSKDVPVENKSRPVVLVVSGDTQGWITPCGCTSNQSGGFPRRASSISNLRKDREVLYADAGGAIDGSSEYHRAKLAAIFRGEVDMNIVAHNVGASELKLGVDALRQLAGETKVPLLSTNIVDRTGNSVFDEIRIVAAGGKRIAFVGVTSSATFDGVIIKPPREAIAQTLAKHRGEYDTLVVLAYLPDQEIDQLARMLPEADYLIGGPTGQPIQPRKQGPLTIASATRKGKFLVEQPLNGELGRIVEMTESFSDDDVQKKNIVRFRNDLRTADLSADQTGLVPASAKITDSVAGSASCVTCHTQENEIWQKSGHAHAWKTLKDAGAESDPSCQVCHTTNYGMPGGFVSARRSPARVDVGCEDCHGPSASHVADVKIKPLYGNNPRDCRTCHDEENSPKFEYQSFWAKIQHGKKQGGAK